MSEPTHIPNSSQDVTLLNKKRKHEDAMHGLDTALGTPSEEDAAVRPAKRPHPSLSLYGALSKYGIKGKSVTKKPFLPPGPGSLTRTPTLTSILSKTAARTRKVLPFTLSASTSASTSHSAPSSTRDCAPASAQAFLERLGTFKPSTYSAKPEAIDAAAAARCGWSNDGRDRLVCSVCAVSWVVAGRDGMARDAAQALVEKQRVQLVSQHKDLCPWRLRQCDASIYTVPMKAPTVMAREILARASAIQSLMEEATLNHPLTSSQINTLQSILAAVRSDAQSPLAQVDVEVASATLSSFASERELPQTARLSDNAVIAAIFGWSPAPPSSTGDRPRVSSISRHSSMAPSRAQSPGVFSSASREGTPVPSTPLRRPIVTPRRTSLASSVTAITEKKADPMLYCHLCQRTVGMWAFTSSPLQSGETPTSEPVTSGNPPRVHAERKFDVQREHRPYCPYVARTTVFPSMPGSAAGGLFGHARSGSASSIASATFSTNGEKIEGWRAVVRMLLRRAQAQTNVVVEESTMGAQEDAESSNVGVLVEHVKSGGGRQFSRYVKGLLGSS